MTDGAEETRKSLAEGQGVTFPNAEEAIKWLKSEEPTEEQAKMTNYSKEISTYTVGKDTCSKCGRELPYGTPVLFNYQTKRNRCYPECQEKE